MAPTLKLRVAVLAGGTSPEREISLRSGQGVAAALREVGHDAVLVDPAGSPLDDVPWAAFDVCFIALHGGAGEDGRVQQELERLGVPYTGSGPQACRLAMSKSAAKERFVQCGVPTPPYAWIDEQEPVVDAAVRIKRLGYPVVVKPDGQGSSLGVAIAESPQQLASALDAARTAGGPTLVEPLVRGREFTVALLDDVVLPMIEIISPEALFSYEAKYDSPRTEYRFDFDLSHEVREAIQRTARAAAQSLGTCGLSRVDLMLAPDGRVWVLEVNTVPGMTIRSLAPLAAARVGIDMYELCDLLVRRCLASTGVQ